MNPSHLPGKPLAEAIFELRWGSPRAGTGVDAGSVDPDYELLIGALYARVRERFPTHVRLPSSAIPPGFIPHRVQHQFRSGPDGWPLVQLGPGVLTVNQTSGYAGWSEFRGHCITALAALFAAHPRASALPLHTSILRYINAQCTESVAADVLLKQLLDVSLVVPKSVFAGTVQHAAPREFKYVSTHEVTEPQGALELMFATGIHNLRPALIWELVLSSNIASSPADQPHVIKWLDGAHVHIEQAFFAMLTDLAKQRFAHA
jgi:uncharacterized protein (TIGR04255 family)